MARRDAVRGPIVLDPRAGDEPEPIVGPKIASSGDLFAAYQARIRRYVLSMVHDPDEADDLTQDVFLQAHRRLSSLRDPDAVVSWLYRIATHVCYDRYRKVSRQPRPQRFDQNAPSVPPADAGDGESSLGQVLERAEMGACVRSYLDQLADDYRNAILLHDLEGLTNAEIAEMTGASLDAVKIRLHRARRKLEAVLSARCDFSLDERGVVVCEPKVYLSPAARRPVVEKRQRDAVGTGGCDNVLGQ